MIDSDTIRATIGGACREYAKTAPTAVAYFEDLYVRFNERPDDVRLSELLFLNRINEEGTWMHPNFLANQVYHLMHRLGMDTTEHAGF